jgi:hypothetical protein
MQHFFVVCLFSSSWYHTHTNFLLLKKNIYIYIKKAIMATTDGNNNNEIVSSDLSEEDISDVNDDEDWENQNGYVL